jgi:hydrogenase maturation protein HypF
MAGAIRKRVRAGGLVQGVGFRPAACRLAAGLGLSGWVANDPAGAALEVEGPAARVAAFLEALASLPPPARVTRMDVEELPVEDDGPQFEIRATARDGMPATIVPTDIGACVACLTEVADPTNRRHGHPFATCAACGPRFTIVESLPFDRAATTMGEFAMCPRCVAEYADPADRRFHAQTISCPQCGPLAWFMPSGDVAATTRATARVTGDAAIAAARAVVRSGGIVAVKGIGGFRLACDATSPAAVMLLRTRKHRRGKPLAVMVAAVEAARAWARIDTHEELLLAGPERPIVLVPKIAGAVGGPAEAVAPGVDVFGVMLPATPLEALVAAGMPPLVMTSGNLAEEPIEHLDQSAVRRLGGIADGFLLHDRRIHVACDDSVVRRVAGGPLLIRRARGYAPLPVPLVSPGPCVLAVGGELKAAVCVTRGAEAFIGQHLGDVEHLETLEAVERSAHHLLGLLGVEPVAVAADLHPGYVSAAWARRFAAARGIPYVAVQHHAAHAAALVAERYGADTMAAEGFIAACFDGTGYGRDGSIQGSEFLVVADGGQRHVASLDRFPLPGGDAAIWHPWRTALALLHAAGIDWDERLPAVRAASDAERRLLARQCERGIGAVACSSMGRLFDAVAALAGVRQSISYEAEAALALESLAAAAASGDEPGYAFDFGDGEVVRIGWRGVVAAAVADVLGGVPAATIAARFHAAVAKMVVDVATRLRDRGAGSAVGLTGGVFQNAVLTERTAAALGQAGFEVAIHRLVPPNDGGLALGQAVIARRGLS